MYFKYSALGIYGIDFPGEDSLLLFKKSYWRKLVYHSWRLASKCIWYSHIARATTLGTFLRYKINKRFGFINCRKLLDFKNKNFSEGKLFLNQNRVGRTSHRLNLILDSLFSKLSKVTRRLRVFQVGTGKIQIEKISYRPAQDLIQIPCSPTTLRKCVKEWIKRRSWFSKLTGWN